MTRLPNPASADDRAALSALADGDATSQDAALALWRSDSGARRDWHAWHLAGDVMRSEDLAGDATRDAAFLSALRTRLAAEPVLLAPAATPSPVPRPRRRMPWLSPLAAAAGVAAVAGVLVLTRTSLPGAGDDDGAVVALGVPAGPGLRLGERGGAQPASLVIEGRMVYDPRYVQYLRIHRENGMRPLQPWGQPTPASAAVPSGR